MYTPIRCVSFPCIFHRIIMYDVLHHPGERQVRNHQQSSQNKIASMDNLCISAQVLYNSDMV